jgi:hypothetical protein
MTEIDLSHLGLPEEASLALQDMVSPKILTEQRFGKLGRVFDQRAAIYTRLPAGGHPEDGKLACR